jgi:hypothetical protein
MARRDDRLIRDRFTRFVTNSRIHARSPGLLYETQKQGDQLTMIAIGPHQQVRLQFQVPTFQNRHTPSSELVRSEFTNCAI